MTKERRRTARKPVEGPHGTGTLILPNGRLPVLVADESSTGVGLFALGSASLTLGAVVEFESKFRHGKARIAHLKALAGDEHDVYRVGLEWVH
ncbi:hypothetical protein Pan216_55500 [Planctomycetes bacterium Pan216]|uniref:PilZ domain-containing protein n=1 Tax=Kolteria novifilia TaxID=2527975 RepID=A0A518BCG2_9BACT|nr:hypothetical protein Pan216_55500 [Planctomycetes bacterium Pan216]